MQSSHEAELVKAELLPPCGDGLCASGGSHVRALNMEGAQITRVPSGADGCPRWCV